ncbi:dihydrodipicolinate synthase family protein [Propionivibrio dicarboxylicus]|uniref:4-hydroxy-tetrahydrodipicolinate synthase n=1 Tax=Propionivibrio dicarboxylicus TaxID=83767 RepID=A0A1G7VP58_9RHOO|nr:dihydrodipicolinate synthase family protein [Propionivibrio dicarboxylicus]SDG61605.1 4-hydroxy-tetrahydrodipicolinate synthase [Propionivibrio dicarboxylicus]
MSRQRIEGIVPVMITPFNESGEIDYAGLERLIEWYIEKGSDALFAVCQSSEMMFLSVDERRALGRFVVKQVAGRVPVVVSGHVSDDPYSQLEELQAAVDTGADGIVLVTNHLDPKQRGTAPFLGNLQWLLDRLPADMPLGLYECPAPYRRLLTDEELRFCIDSGRFVLLKDVSCDLETVKRRVAMTAGTPFAILNANAAIAYDAMKAGSRGFNGVFTNFHPDLYKWLYTQGAQHPALAAELANFLVLAALAEPFGYPVLAKMYHQRIGTFASIKSRTITFDVRERFWALDAILDKIVEGTEMMRARIAAL